MNVLSLYDYSAEMVKPWVDAGHDCWCIDIQHPEMTEIKLSGLTLLSLEIVSLQKNWSESLLSLHNWDIIFAFPPCDSMAVSGAKHFKKKGLSAIINALEMVNAAKLICENAGCPFMLENPVSTLSTYWRKPDHIFHPFQFGGYPGGENDGYTKRTCLWTGGGFVMPERKPIPRDPITSDRIHKAPPGPDRKNFRSQTPAGFANAVFLSNS